MDRDRFSRSAGQPAATFSSTAEARAVVERFLCGEAVDGDLYRQALRYLEVNDPAVPVTLASNASGISAADALRDDIVCDEILESLEAYASLGADAAGRMPEVHLHLKACPSCRQDLDAARAALGWTLGILADAVAAETPARGPVSPRPFIIERDHQWLLARKDQETPVPLEQVPLESGFPLGSWKLEVQQVIMARGSESEELSETAEDEAAEPLTLTTVLPGDRAQIQLVISLGGRSESGQNPWRLSLSGTKFFELASLSVRLLNEGGDATLFETTLFPDSPPQVFYITPDPAERYQLIFGGVTPQDETYSQRLVLPLAAAAHETDGQTP